MAAWEFLYLHTLTTLCLLSLCASQSQPLSPPQSLLNAAETLSNAGHTSMSLTLQLVSPTLPPSSASSLTIFSPPNTAFVNSGQPSLNLLLLHFSPLSLSLSSLQSLPFATQIPTLSPSATPLIVTTLPSDPQPSLNNVKISPSPIFDDGSVIVFSVDDFFNPNFTLAPSSQVPRSPLPSTIRCAEFESFSSFYEVTSVLKSRGYSIMASFLDLQLLGFMTSFSSEKMKLTVFAPVDEVMVEYAGQFPEYFSLLFRHLVPCILSWTELSQITNGTTFSYFDGLDTKITKNTQGLVFVNGVEITFPDMYYSDWIVVHGLRQVIPLMDDGMDEDDEGEDDDDDQIMEDSDDFITFPERSHGKSIAPDGEF